MTIDETLHEITYLFYSNTGCRLKAIEVDESTWLRLARLLSERGEYPCGRNQRPNVIFFATESGMLEIIRAPFPHPTRNDFEKSG